MKKILLSLSVVFVGIFLVTAPLVSAEGSVLTIGQTASSEDACQTLRQINPDGEGCGAANGGINGIIRLVLNLLSIAAGLIGVIMIIVSGFKYITAQGDATELSNAKKTLIYAIAGLVVVVFAQFIVRFVLARAGNA